MNREAERHLDIAKTYLEQGDDFYGKAADEIIAAKKSDPMLTNAAIGARFGHEKDWVTRLVSWRTNDSRANHGAPFGGQSENTRKAASHAKTVLKDAPMEQVEQIISQLPPERKQAIAAAAGHGYSQARQDYDETERNLTPAQHKAREANLSAVDDHVAGIMAPITALDIANTLEIAADKIKYLTSHNQFSPESDEIIARALTMVLDELEVGRAMAGLELA